MYGAITLAFHRVLVDGPQAEQGRCRTGRRSVGFAGYLTTESDYFGSRLRTGDVIYAGNVIYGVDVIYVGTSSMGGTSSVRGSGLYPVLLTPS